jgi:hypothetical protein
VLSGVAVAADVLAVRVLLTTPAASPCGDSTNPCRSLHSNDLP